MAVDYLTRLVMGAFKPTVFETCLEGAAKVNELKQAKELLEWIDWLDDYSIDMTCKLVGYDVAFKRGPKYFTPIDNIQPSKEVIRNIKIMVRRSKQFLKKENKPLVLNGFNFHGAYNSVIKAGEGDYLTEDTLWDFKVSESKPTIEYTLQILVYYILGLHSIHHNEFNKIKKLGIYNPELNTAYTIALSDIPEKVFYDVSKDVIGYCMPKNIKDWRKAYGTSEQAKNELWTRVIKEFQDTGFSPDNYQDGIHDITVDDYWSYYRKITLTKDNCTEFRRPNKVLQTQVAQIKFIKNSGFIMFVSISKTGCTSILYGGRRHSIKKPLQYYYENLPKYGGTILDRFSNYWDALYNISSQLQSIKLNDQESKTEYEKVVLENKKWGTQPSPYEIWCQADLQRYSFSGKVHGCIVDLDYSRHIYLNPYDGSIAAYSAPSMSTKNVYDNVISLIATEKSEMLPAFKRKINLIETDIDKKTTELTLKEKSLSIFKNDEINKSPNLVTDTSMYKVSNRMNELQKIYDYHLVGNWYDDVLPNSESSEKKRIELKATSIVQKKDSGKSKKSKSTRKKISYVGKTAKMNCGLNATVIEDFGCKNITVRFEDGLVKKKCRRDKFREGNIGHKA
ncbi:hypothetical protein [Ligilactobacillus apodemi]|nr:hypothetical protein [Ligilactobacillus apodemi]